jgi:hypothetical protein
MIIILNCIIRDNAFIFFLSANYFLSEIIFIISFKLLSANSLISLFFFIRENVFIGTKKEIMEFNKIKERIFFR